ncbi:inositol-tetrakisphosphate 1-kinase-like [Pieris rapae]|uniref:inositol-tetrakisphosphate 1-kinase-like n=1 Tax=Pieris rapae TaxID=64459 RepID=UPI001E27AD7C|nr:inositol-tetrakisphosphate 1-kinase-like [Pieris rapae]
MSEIISLSKTIGIWISEKKSHKLNWNELVNVCRRHGYNLIKLNLDQPIEEQGNLDVFLHKLTDIIAASDQGDSKASSIIGRVEQYISNHPNVTIIDPLNNVRILLNRYTYYSIIQEEISLQKIGVFTPAFAKFTTNNIEQNIEIMKQRGVTFPVICKPTLAHGSKLAHEMILVCNQRGLNVCKPPCVVQSFVNHSAVLYKVFVVGNRYHICQRPSLKNFYPSDDMEPIYYSTGEVSKACSQSTLSILDPNEVQSEKAIDDDKVRMIIKVLRKRIGLLLLGFDIVIDNWTGNHALIDINVFPSYDTFPNYFENLLDCIEENVKNNENRFNGLINVGSNSIQCGVTGMNIN